MSSPPLHIIHVEAGKHLYGGAQQVIYLLRGLRARGHRSQLVCPAGAAVGGDVGRHQHQGGVEHGKVHVLTDPGALALQERRGDREGGHVAGRVVHHRRA